MAQDLFGFRLVSVCFFPIFFLLMMGFPRPSGAETWNTWGTFGTARGFVGLGATSAGAVIVVQDSDRFSLTDMVENHAAAPRSLTSPGTRLDLCNSTLMHVTHGHLIICPPYFERVMIEGDEQRSHSLPNVLVPGDAMSRVATQSSPQGTTVAASTYRDELSLWRTDEPTASFARVAKKALLHRATGLLSPSVVWWNDAFHVLVPMIAFPDPKSGHPQHRLDHLVSLDGGRTWHEMTIANAASTINDLLMESTLIGDENRLWAAYVLDSALYVQRLDKGQDVWSSPIKLNICGNVSHLQSARIGSRAVLLWASDCYQESESWSKWPLADIWSPDARRTWLNNDVFLLPLEASAEQHIEPTRLTEPLSYTDSLVSLGVDGGGYVARTGRRKVGYELNSFGAPEEVFWLWIPQDKVFHSQP